MSSMDRNRSWTRVWDRVRLLGVAIAISGCGIAYAIFAIGQIDPKWIGLAIQSATLFGYIVTLNRSMWPCSRFWQVVILLFAMHSIVFVLVLLRIYRIPLFLFVVLGVLEVLLYQSLIEKYGHSRE